MTKKKKEVVWALEMSFPCSGKEVRGEDGQLRATAIRAEEAVPWL